ncbi:MAG: zinc-ribbon domain-containing protein [Deltaproteobacteria bacterium]|nr:zinc-ribbon domain-containing protein [Deltaproteobacteria bacterium]MCL5791646.1 zinc-ribbon domain-containing protein [Deltaproteobacteria bacterium]
MIVICDKCNTKYKLDDTAITEDGVKVRCTKCGNTFIVKKPKKEDVENLAQSKQDAGYLQSDIHDELDKAIKETIGDIAGEKSAVQNPGTEFDWSALIENKEASPEHEYSEPKPEDELSDFNDAIKKEEPIIDHAQDQPVSAPEVSDLPTPIVEHMIRETIKHGREEDAAKNTALVLKKIILIFSVLILMSVIGYSGYMYKHEITEEANKVYLLLSEQIANKKPINVGVSVASSKGYFMKNVRGQQLFVIEGDVTNTKNKSLSFIKLKASILDNNNNLVSSKSFYAANVFTDEELRTLTSDQINKKLNNEMGQSLKNFNVPPETSIPFAVVFFDVPNNLSSYTIIPESAHPGTQ